MPVPLLLRQRRTWLIGIPVLVLLVAVVAPWLYINVLRNDPPAPLSFQDVATTAAGGGVASTTTAASGVAPDGIEGIWTVTTGSQAGYRVKEVLFGQDAEAVGRTVQVSGTLQISGSSVTAADVTVDMAAVTSSESRRDGQFRNRIMDTATYPTATFTLRKPIELGAVPADGTEVTYTVTGDLALRGVTRSVTVDLTARRNGASIELNGSISVDFDVFQIPDASGGPAKVGRSGQIELLLVFAR